MTIKEKINMYRNKRNFIRTVSKAFETLNTYSSVTSIDYEVYKKEAGNDFVYYYEFVVVTFIGGAKCVKLVNGNSNIANFRAVGSMLDGGYYDEIPNYESLEERRFTLVSLDEEV